MIDALATDLVFQPLNFSRNRLEAIIDPADTTLTSEAASLFSNKKRSFIRWEAPNGQNVLSHYARLEA